MNECRSSSETLPGGNAFPIASQQEGDWFPGMSLRDYFAAAALQGMLASQSTSEACKDMSAAAKNLGVTVASYMSMAAYITADAMLRERDREHD